MTKEKTQEIVGIRWMGPNQCDMPLVGWGGGGVLWNDTPDGHRAPCLTTESTAVESLVSQGNEGI